jgi:hypothetical protein
MAWFTKTPPRGIEIPKLIMAAHEVGHFIAFRDAGMPVRRVEIDLNGDTGFNRVDEPGDNQHHGFLIAVMGGAAGEKLWCDVYGQELPPHCRNGHSYLGDLTEFRSHQRRHRETRGLSWRKAERLARDILRDNNKRFRQLTEQLAVDGELDPRR